MEKAQAGIPDFIQKYVLDMINNILGTIDWVKIGNVALKAVHAGVNAFIDALEASLRNHEIEIGGSLHESVEAFLINLLEKLRVTVKTTMPVLA